MFTDLLPGFPNTSEDGFAYVVNVSAWTDEQKKAVAQNVMYSFAQAGVMDKKSRSTFLNDSPVYRTNYTCTGIIHCEYLNQEIKGMHHTEVTPLMLNTIRQVQKKMVVI